ncbi:MAG: hypothetical protein CW345_06370 [Firmicutes bacterium]|nr:hypothetical protein [Bacillota bacterium]
MSLPAVFTPRALWYTGTAFGENWRRRRVAAQAAQAVRAFFIDLWRRLRRKIAAMVPLVLGAAAFALVLAGVIYVLSPLLPEEYRAVLQLIHEGDWEASRLTLSELFDGYGPAKAWIFVGLQMLQVLFAPVPGQLVGLLGGYLFGFWHGLLLTMAGLVAGSLLAMLLGRWLGERLVRRAVPKPVLEKFDYLVTQGGLWNFFMLYLLPALPDDALCFVAGLTRWPIVQLLAVSAAGRLPGMAVLVYVGASVGSGGRGAQAVLACAMLLAAALWLYSEEAESYFYRLSRRGAPGSPRR